MLKNIHPSICPELLKTLCEMGHGDEIILADAHFPAHSLNQRVIRADGLAIDTLLKGITPLFEFDAYVDAPLVMMQTVAGDSLDPSVEEKYRRAITQVMGSCPNILRIDRFAFYERAKNAYALVITGERAKYANLILKKGVTPEYQGFYEI